MIYKLLLYAAIITSPIYIWLWYVNKKYPANPYELVLIYGKPGVGKTIDIARRCLEDLRTGWIPYANVKVNIPGVRYFDAEEFGNYTFENHSHIYIDEAGILWNNREAMKRNGGSFTKQKIKFLKLYRHAQCSIYAYSQAPDVDITVRRLASSEWIFYKVFGYFSVQRKLKKELKVLPPEQCKDADSQLVNVLEQYSIFTPGALKIFYQPKYFGYTDTYEMPPYEQYPYEMMHGEIKDRKTRQYLLKQYRLERKKRKKLKSSHDGNHGKKKDFAPDVGASVSA